MSIMKSSLIHNGIQKPIRYLGKEFNSIVKHDAKAKMLLAFPDTYEIGMSHFGSKILYDLINSVPEYAVERTYMPWKDFKHLYSMETYSEMNQFDAIGFSMQHELCYTNILAMLEMGGLEIFSDKRDDQHPIIIAGGGSTFNPQPMANFIDIFVIGDAEPVILDIFKILASTKSRKERLFEFSKLNGVFVPSIHSKTDIIKRNMVASLDDVPIITSPVVPYLEAVHNRLTYEIQRGCNRGCRFCQAGTIYRPVRQRNPQSIIDMIDKNISETGYREIGFLSLNACDYAPLLPLIKYISETYKKIGISVSLPSLRVESISDEFLDILAKLPKGGFTIAPEAGSDKLRRVINKDIAEQETLSTVEKVTARGWEHIKAYFMIGLPTETDDDIHAIIDLANKMESKLKSRRGKITVSVSNFVPKPHTPFQWEQQLDSKAFAERLLIFSSTLKNRRISLKWSDPKMSEIEGILSRSDEKIGKVIYDAYKMGEIFSSWGNEFNYEIWQKALELNNINGLDYLSSMSTEKKLPWDNIACGVEKSWMIKEKEKAYSAIMTSNCIEHSCTACGVCNTDSIKNIMIDDKNSINFSYKKVALYNSEKTHAIRGLFKKVNAFKWMGHFELMSLMEKALLKSGFPIAVSSGFKPAPVMSFCPPAGAGIESEVEMADLFFSSYVSPDAFIKKLNSILPEELGFKQVWSIPVHSTSIFQLVREYIWEAQISGMQEQEIRNGFDKIQDSEFDLERKGKIRTIKVADYFKLNSINLNDNIITINFSIHYIDGKSIKPLEVLRAVMQNLNEDNVSLYRKGMRLDGYNTYN